ncbi:MAG TPA: histidine phosphatase family protein [Deinococcales bacterium]|nr:histidine phosphatase family protein [Deinococcales bacterium]
MPSDLYIVRHGQTTYNASGTKTFTGWIDVDVSEFGAQQAAGIGEMLKDIPFDIAYTSRLVRARHTLEIVLRGRQVPVVIDDRIIERSYGDLSGQLHADVKAKYPDLYPIWHRSFDVPPPGGESVKMVEKRVYPFIHELLRTTPDGRKILISAHGNSIRAMRAYLENLSVEEEMKLEVPQDDYLHYRFTSDPTDLFGGQVEKIHPSK